MLELFIFVCVFSFLGGVISGIKNPPTYEQRMRAKERRRKTALFLGTTAAVTSVKLIKDNGRKRR